jgi:G3E family GTPase
VGIGSVHSQILTNGIYKSVEHRVVVNSERERLTVACFINPANDTLVAPIPKLLNHHHHHRHHHRHHHHHHLQHHDLDHDLDLDQGRAAMEEEEEKPAYIPMTFRAYRSFIRKRGTNGKAHLNFVAVSSSSSQSSSSSS